MATTTKKTTAATKTEVKSPEVQKREEAFAALQNQVDIITEAKNTGSKSATEIATMEEVAKKLLDDYNTILREQAYEAFSKAEDPVKAMIEARYIGVCKLSLNRKSKETGRFMGEIIPVDEKISLLVYKETYGNKAFADGKWWSMTQKFAALAAGAVNKALTNDPEFKYAIDQGAVEFKFSPDADPSSKNSRMKALQMIFNAIHPGVKADSHDVAYIEMSMTKNKSTGKIQMVNTYKMTEYITDCMHIRMTDKKYELV